MDIKQDELVKLAASFIGTKETGKNVNPFSKELNSVDYFDPQKKVNAPWCSIFLSDMAYKKIKDVNKTHKWLYQPTYNDLSASASHQQKYFKKAKRYYRQPRVGDWAFIGSPATHVCIVESYTATSVTTIDGNHKDKVARVVRPRSDFDGYGRPKYSGDNDIKEDKVMIEMDVLKRGANDPQVGTLQTLLRSKGYKGVDKKVLALDCKFGANTEFALKKYQGDNALEVTAQTDKATWNKLLKGGS